MWYGVEDIEIILQVAQSKAYQVIRTLGIEISKTKMPDKDRCYARPPAGKIQKAYFCEKYMLDVDDCDKLIAQKKGAEVRTNENKNRN